MKSLIDSILVRVGQYDFRHVGSVQIVRDWRDLSPSCTIQLPAFGRFSGSPGLWESVEIKPNDPVAVYMGYDGNRQVEFEGYVSSIDAQIPYTIHCEGESYQLKRKPRLSKSWKSITLRALLEEVLNGDYTIDGSLPEVELSPFSIKSQTPAQVLRRLSEEYIFAAYFRGKSLFVGLPYTEQAGTVNYGLQENIISEDLTYRTEDQYAIQVKAVSINRDNTRTSVQVGDPDGELRTITKKNIKSDAQLRTIANEQLKLMKYDGYEGSLLAFGEPYCDHGWTAEIKDAAFPERSGNYVIDRVVVQWGRDGFRRRVTLGKRI